MRGPDWDKLGDLAERIRQKLTDSGLAVDMDTSYLVGVPEVRLPPSAGAPDWRSRAIKGTRPAYFPQAGGFVDATVYDRYALAASATFSAGILSGAVQIRR